MKAIHFVLMTVCLLQNLVRADDHSFNSKSNSERPIADQIDDGGETELLARMGEVVSPSGYRRLVIYSPGKLKNLQYRVGEAENWDVMTELKSEDYNAYGTINFLPSAPGQKFTFRAIREDGTRVTSLIEIDSKDPKIVRVKTLKEEPKGSFKEEKQADATSGTSSVLQKAQANIGRRIGSGDCSALRGSGPALGRIGSGGAGMEQLVPGQVLRLSPGAGLQGSMGSFRTGGSGHFIVVESVEPNGKITFLDQNWAGGGSAGRTVRRASANLRTLNGSATIYSGN